MNNVELFNEVLAHFLTVFPVESPPRELRRYIADVLRLSYSDEVLENFLAARFEDIQDALVREFNDRGEDGASIRYMFADDDGKYVEGIGGLAQADRIAFQDGINSLTSAEFEAFSAHVLRLASCNRVWKTQETHDEGLDAFGYMSYFQINNEWIGSPEVIFLAQAKHYSDCKVGSRDIREFVGSSRLAALRIYSKIDDRYTDLDIKPFAPVALIFVTTQEVPRTVKNMGRASGIVVLTSDDLCRLFYASIPGLPQAITAVWIAGKIRELCADLQTAR